MTVGTLLLVKGVRYGSMLTVYLMLRIDMS